MRGHIICRWDTASNAGISWAGQDIPAVQIDKFGKFQYILVRLSDRIAGTKLIVRGKNGRTESQLVSAVSKEVCHVPRTGIALSLHPHTESLLCCSFKDVNRKH